MSKKIVKTVSVSDPYSEEKEKKEKQLIGPLVRRRFQNGLKIQDLEEDRFDRAVEMVLRYYLPEDVIFRNTRIAEDQVSLQCFSERLLNKLKSNASVVAIDEKNGNCLVAILVLGLVTKCDYGRSFSQTVLLKGDAYKSVSDFKSFMRRNVDIFEQFGCESFLRYYLLCIRPEYRGMALGYQMMLVSVEMARRQRTSVMAGLFSSYRMQNIAKQAGINQVLYTYPYVEWSDTNHELIFKNTGMGNFVCNIQAGFVPPPPEPDPTTSTILFLGHHGVGTNQKNKKKKEKEATGKKKKAKRVK